MNPQRLVVGISGSSGAILGVRLLQALQPLAVETHLVITPAARLTIRSETDTTVAQVEALADAVYAPGDLGASIASGSFETLGMVVIPCSIKTLSAIANSYTADLLARAADVTLKEGRPLLLVVREAPLHRGHVRLLDLAAQAGAVIFPPVPAFYAQPKTVDDIVDNIVGRVLRRLRIDNSHYQVWQGLTMDSEADVAAQAEDESAAAAIESTAANRSAGPFPGEGTLWSLPAMTLSTTGADRTPHAATVYFAASPNRGALYFFSSPKSRHSRNLQENPLTAASIYPLVDGWHEITGLQLRGNARPVHPGPEWDTAWALYAEKFPFARALQEVVSRSTLYAFRPVWARLTDNRRGFGFKEEWQASDDGNE